MIKLKIVLLILLMTFPACVTQNKCLKRYPPEVISDSSYIEKIRLVPIRIPGFIQRAEAPVSCPDQYILLIDNNKLKQEIAILNGKLISNTTFKPDSVNAPIIEKITTIKEIKVPQPVKFIPKFYIYCTWMLIGLVVAATGFGVMRLFKTRIL